MTFGINMLKTIFSSATNNSYENKQNITGLQNEDINMLDFGPGAMFDFVNPAVYNHLLFNDNQFSIHGDISDTFAFKGDHNNITVQDLGSFQQQGEYNTVTELLTLAESTVALRGAHNTDTITATADNTQTNLEGSFNTLNYTSTAKGYVVIDGNDNIANLTMTKGNINIGQNSRVGGNNTVNLSFGDNNEAQTLYINPNGSKNNTVNITSANANKIISIGGGGYTSSIDPATGNIILTDNTSNSNNKIIIDKNITDIKIVLREAAGKPEKTINLAKLKADAQNPVTQATTITGTGTGATTTGTGATTTTTGTGTGTTTTGTGTTTTTTGTGTGTGADTTTTSPTATTGSSNNVSNNKLLGQLLILLLTLLGKRK